MRLEKHIHQNRKFRNEHHKSVVNLILTGNWVNEQMKKLIASTGITTQQYNILRILQGSAKPLTILQIRERMLDKMSDTSRLVDRLIQKELVVKKVNKIDKRLVDIYISAKGKRFLSSLEKIASSIDDIARNLNQKEARLLNQLLDKVKG
ncbi:MAG: MarR family winged helix-turn-helix transcriptional regulator [Lacibacter sp.]|jgi:DNA-binding MarR family transcriptional regulator